MGFRIPFPGNVPWWDKKSDGQPTQTFKQYISQFDAIASTNLSDLPIPLSSGGTGAAKNNYVNVGLSATGQVVASGGTGADIIFDTKISDADTVFTLASGKYTPNVAGNFLVTVGTQWSTALGDGVSFGAGIFRNGAEFIFALNLTGANAVNAGALAVAIIPMNGTTDFITARAFQASGGNQTVGVLVTRTFMQAQRLPS